MDVGSLELLKTCVSYRDVIMANRQELYEVNSFRAGNSTLGERRFSIRGDYRYSRHHCPGRVVHRPNDGSDVLLRVER